MKPKAAMKIAVDILMTLALLFLMGYQFWQDAAHEWAGTGMFLLFILHHILNGNWHRAVFRGRYTPARVFQLVIDLLVLLAVIGLMVSGVILSNHVFAFLPIRGGMGFARLLHMAASYWGFVLMALHLGLHWGMVLGMGRKALRPSRIRRVLLPVLGGCVAVYGLIAFLRRDLITYMHLYAGADPLRVFRLQRAHSAFLSGLSGHDGDVHLPGLFHLAASAEAGGEIKVKIFPQN